MATSIPAITDKFRSQSIDVERLKQPFIKRDSNGVPIAAGYLCFSYNEGNNSFKEYYVDCTQEVFSKVITQKLFRVPNVKITLTFNDRAVATEIVVSPNIKEKSYYGFSIHPEDKRDLESEFEDIGVNAPIRGDELECIVQILKSPDENGMYAALKLVPKHVSKTVASEILSIVSSIVKSKKKIHAKDILNGKYIVNSTGNDGEYIYVRAMPIA